jgi:hypothetical protein
MNILTKNRILQKGDEYYDGKTWKPVPESDFGSQVVFTNYKEARRPSEEPPKNFPVPVLATPITDECGNGGARESTPSPQTDSKIDSRGGEKSAIQWETDYPGVKSQPISPDNGERPVAKAEGEQVTLRPVARMQGERPITINYPHNAPPCIWIGRNGTFKQRGITMHKLQGDDVIRIRPIGKRGVGKNAHIEFPTSTIPQIVDWLLRQQK